MGSLKIWQKLLLIVAAFMVPLTLLMTELIVEAARMTGQRILLSKGWGGMGSGELQSRLPARCRLRQ